MMNDRLESPEVHSVDWPDKRFDFELDLAGQMMWSRTNERRLADIVGLLMSRSGSGETSSAF
jgi:hypothetical protein